MPQSALIYVKTFDNFFVLFCGFILCFYTVYYSEETMSQWPLTSETEIQENFLPQMLFNHMNEPNIYCWIIPNSASILLPSKDWQLMYFLDSLSEWLLNIIPF